MICYSVLFNRCMTKRYVLTFCPSSISLNRIYGILQCSLLYNNSREKTMEEVPTVYKSLTIKDLDR
jgi:hypothetical protein